MPCGSVRADRHLAAFSLLHKMPTAILTVEFPSSFSDAQPLGSLTLKNFGA